jgi:hypothetical protein
MADCSLVLGRRSVFISLVLADGRAGRGAPDLGLMIARAARAGKVKVKRQRAKVKTETRAFIHK